MAIEFFKGKHLPKEKIRGENKQDRYSNNHNICCCCLSKKVCCCNNKVTDGLTIQNLFSK